MNNLQFTFSELVDDLKVPTRLVAEVLEKDKVTPTFYDKEEPIYIFDKLSYLGFRLSVSMLKMEKITRHMRHESLN